MVWNLQTNYDSRIYNKNTCFVRFYVIYHMQIKATVISFDWKFFRKICNSVFQLTLYTCWKSLHWVHLISCRGTIRSRSSLRWYLKASHTPRHASLPPQVSGGELARTYPTGRLLWHRQWCGVSQHQTPQLRLSTSLRICEWFLKFSGIIYFSWGSMFVDIKILLVRGDIFLCGAGLVH